jgi:hypothetical protein
MVLGAGLVLAVPFSFALFGMAGVALAAGGLVIALISYAAYSALDIFIPFQHDMKTHVFQPGSCEGGRLYYQCDVPILSLDADDPRKAGKAHGYLLGEHLNRIYKKLDFVMHTLAREPRAEEIKDTIQQVKRTIPTEYLEEMEGMVEGFNQWAEEHPFSSPRRLTLDEVILVHLMPDHHNFHPGQEEVEGLEFFTPLQDVACSVLIDRDEKEGITFGRNMDWSSFGLLGAHSLIINRKHASRGYTTVEVGIPGFIGTITGMNSQGLSLSMNVCMGTNDSIKGMPAAFFNRYCLEHQSSVREVKSFVSHHQPLGAYHLTVADAQEARSFHFYQSYDEGHVEREWTPDHPLVVLNCRYSNDGTTSSPMHHSNERAAILSSYFNQARQKVSSREKAKLVAHGLSLPFVNNELTTHKVVMQPELGTMKVAFNNAWAGKDPLHEVRTRELFTTF